MSTSQKGKIDIELGRTLTDFAAMTDSGDNQIFTAAGSLWSGKSGFEPDIRPDGIVTGSRLLSTHASDDTVTVAGFTAYSLGTLYTVSAGSQAVTRPTVSDYKISSIIMTDAGALDETEGTEGSSFSATRGAAGGPPLIPVGAVEIGQVRMSAQASAAIAADEIYQDIGQHAEYSDYPGYEVFNVGKGPYKAEASAEVNAHVKFNVALPTIHTGTVTKGVYASYYTPTFTTLPKTADFSPAEVGVSKQSETYYEGAGGSGSIGSMKADTVGDVTFTVFAGDGVTDAIIREKNEIVTVRWYPDANKAAHMISQGLLGFSREFPSGSQNKINATVYCEKESVEFAS